MSEALEFFVPGVPIAQGSKRHVGKGIMVEANDGLRPWREAIATEALRELGDFQFFGAVTADLTFRFARPKGHYGTGRNAGKIKGAAPLYKQTKPDVDKLARAVLDALTQAGVLRDDALVVSLFAVKLYDPRPGVKVVIRHV